MTRYQSFIVHAPLLVLLILVIAERPGPTAEAEPSRVERRLGPADAVILQTDDEDVDLRAVEGGVAWGDRPTDRTWAIGIVDVPRLMRTLMESERFEEDRRALREEAESQAAEFEARAEAFQSEAGDLQPDDPEFPAAQQQWQMMMQEYQQWQQGTLAIQQKLGSEQIETAYRELLDAVDIVAERQGVEMVIRFVPPDLPFESETIDQASDQVSRRILLKYPDRIDLTDRVTEELGI